MSPGPEASGSPSAEPSRNVSGEGGQGAFEGEGDTFEARTAALFGFLQDLGIRTETLRHPPVFTVEEARVLRGGIPGAHTKNLFLKDKKGRLFLMVAEESRVIDLKTLHTRIGASGRLSFAGADRMAAHLGVEPGSVTAFAVLNDREGAVSLVLDRGLLLHDIVNCHPVVNRATTSIAREDLLRFFEPTGHPPLLVPLCDAANDDERVRLP